MLRLRLFEVHLPASDPGFPEDGISLATWQYEESEAFEDFKRHFKNESDNDLNEEDYGNVTIQDQTSIADIRPEEHAETPGPEKRPEILRKLNWQIEGDNSCRLCGYFEMGGAVPVCSDCDQCEDCGCMAGCECADCETMDEDDLTDTDRTALYSGENDDQDFLN